MNRNMPKTTKNPIRKNIAVIGAGMAGLACARTLVQAGHRVTVFEKSDAVGGRMASCDSPFGTFDHGAQYFTVRDPRFAQVLGQTPALCRPGAPTRCACWTRTAWWPKWRCPSARRTGSPCRAWMRCRATGPNRLPGRRSARVADTRVTRIERDDRSTAASGSCSTAGPQDSLHVYSGFDAVMVAIPAAQAAWLLAPQRDWRRLRGAVSHRSTSRPAGR
jgi:renalase